MAEWHAQVNGGYGMNTESGKENMTMIWNYLKEQGYTIQAASAVIGNMNNESGLNPWRYENDTYTTTGGYGLLQYTPASQYLNATNIPIHYPNKSTTSVTTGARAEDAVGQLYAFVNDLFGKWVSNIWRDYWDTSTYTTAWAKMQSCREKYGRYITQDTFKTLTDISDASFIFLGGFEGPANPSTMARRESDSYTAYDYLSTSPETGIPIWLYFKMKERNAKNGLL